MSQVHFLYNCNLCTRVESQTEPRARSLLQIKNPQPRRHEFHFESFLIHVNLASTIIIKNSKSSRTCISPRGTVIMRVTFFGNIIVPPSVPLKSHTHNPQQKTPRLITNFIKIVDYFNLNEKKEKKIFGLKMRGKKCWKKLGITIWVRIKRFRMLREIT